MLHLQIIRSSAAACGGFHGLNPFVPAAWLSFGEAMKRRAAASLPRPAGSRLSSLRSPRLASMPNRWSMKMMFVDAVRAQLATVDGVLVWVNPIHEGRNRVSLDALLRDVAARGVWVSAPSRRDPQDGHQGGAPSHPHDGLGLRHGAVSRPPRRCAPSCRRDLPPARG